MLHMTPIESHSPALPPVTRSIRTLLLDDSNFDRARIRRLSHKTDLPIELDEVASIADMDQAVSRNHYDLILIDYRLPVGDGMVALDHVVRNALNRDAGKIMITGNGAVETAVQAMRSGCHDFLSKDDMNSDQLREAILNAVSVARHNQTLALQAAKQRILLRDGLVAALKDDEVQGNVVSLVKDHFGHGVPIGPLPNSADLDIMLSRLSDEDEFIFH